MNMGYYSFAPDQLEIRFVGRGSVLSSLVRALATKEKGSWGPPLAAPAPTAPSSPGAAAPRPVPVSASGTRVRPRICACSAALVLPDLGPQLRRGGASACGRRPWRVELISILRCVLRFALILCIWFNLPGPMNPTAVLINPRVWRPMEFNWLELLSSEISDPENISVSARWVTCNRLL